MAEQLQASCDWLSSDHVTTLTRRNGRDWGTCNGACGAVETFKACADIAIIGRTLENGKLYLTVKIDWRI